MTSDRDYINGFTLIELLVVVGIIGILVAIALPQFASYNARGFDSRAKSDLRNVATAQEAYFVDNSAFRSCSNASCVSAFDSILAISPGVSIVFTATASGFTGTASHVAGSGIVFTWDSNNGGMQ